MAERRKPGPRKRAGGAKVVNLFNAAVDGGPPPAPEQRGRLLYVEDVQALLGRKADGSFRKSAWWVTHNVAPDAKKRLGRDCVWYEADVLAWLDEQAADA